MTVAMSAYTINDVMVQAIGMTLPLSQILVLRGVLVTAMLVVLARVYRERLMLQTRVEWVFVLLRAAVEVGATYFFLSALLVMPIANATAIMQCIPLSVTLVAAIMLPEKVGWRRITAIFVGFLGMLLIVRPDAEGFVEGTFYVLLAVAFITVRDMLTRFIPDRVPAISTSIMTAIGVTVFGAMLSLEQTWLTPSNTHYLLLVGASVMLLAGYVFSVLSVRDGDVSFTAAFRYSGLLVALIAGVLLYREWPDALTALGALIVVAAGLFSLMRERQTHTAG